MNWPPSSLSSMKRWWLRSTLCRCSMQEKAGMPSEGGKGSKEVPVCPSAEWARGPGKEKYLDILGWVEHSIDCWGSTGQCRQSSRKGHPPQQPQGALASHRKCKRLVLSSALRKNTTCLSGMASSSSLKFMSP